MGRGQAASGQWGGLVLEGVCRDAQAGFQVMISSASQHKWHAASNLSYARSQPQCCCCFQLAETLFCGEIPQKSKLSLKINRNCK